MGEHNFSTTALTIQVCHVKNSLVHFPVYCEIDREGSKQTETLHEIPSMYVWLYLSLGSFKG